MINTGDTSWLLVSSALVLLMTPGIAFFYSGLVPIPSVINTLNMCFICLAAIPIVWVFVGYSLVFAPGNSFIGGIEWIGLKGVVKHHTKAIQVPQYAFICFEMMFAVISPALIAGALIGRIRFKPFVIFVILWSLLIYCPIAHWVWGPGGWIAKLGAIDFAGGMVVHINAGFAALIAALILGPRIENKKYLSGSPHNIPLVILGASLLWYGWLGFNGGSAIVANNVASLAVLTTILAPAASIFTWAILSWIRVELLSATGISCVAVTGLVAITPAAGYVTPSGSLLIGCMSAIFYHFAMKYRHRLLGKIDDTLDVFICHGLGGVIGAIMTGLLATTSVNVAGANGLFYGNSQLLVKQIIAVGATIAMSMIGTAFLLYLIKICMEIRPTPEDEMKGIDMVEHGESAYGLLKQVLKSTRQF